MYRFMQLINQKYNLKLEVSVRDSRTCSIEYTNLD